VLPNGSKVGDYEIDATLGSGGVADVYRVVHRSTQLVRALKLARSGVEDKIQQSVVAEAALLVDIDSPYVVHQYGLLEYEGRPGLLMEFVDGPALDEWMDDQTEPVPVSVALKLFGRIALGVAACHRDQVVHRDLKPENVLLTADMTPKLTDFGLAKRDAGGRLDPRRGLSQYYRNFGTPEYMAPEQVHSAEMADHRADLWSLGILLYELLCDRPPFEGTRHEILIGATRGDYKPASEVRSDVSTAVDAMIRKLLQSHINDRFQDIDTVLRTHNYL